MKLLAVILVGALAVLASAHKPNPKAVKKMFKGTESSLNQWLTDFLKERAFPNVLGSPRLDRVQWSTVVPEKNAILSEFTASNLSTQHVGMYTCTAVVYVRVVDRPVDEYIIEEIFMFDPAKDMKCVQLRDPLIVC